MDPKRTDVVHSGLDVAEAVPSDGGMATVLAVNPLARCNGQLKSPNPSCHPLWAALS